MKQKRQPLKNPILATRKINPSCRKCRQIIWSLEHEGPAEDVKKAISKEYTNESRADVERGEESQLDDEEKKSSSLLSTSVLQISTQNAFEFFRSPGGQTHWQCSDSLLVAPRIGFGH